MSFVYIPTLVVIILRSRLFCFNNIVQHFIGNKQTFITYYMTSSLNIKQIYRFIGESVLICTNLKIGTSMMLKVSAPSVQHILYSPKNDMFRNKACHKQ